MRDLGTDRPQLGLRPNAAQFALLVVVNALVGGMVGQERTVLPLLAEEVFGLGNAAAILTYIAAFGVTKALTNLAAGVLADRFGRKPDRRGVRPAPRSIPARPRLRDHRPGGERRAGA